MTQTPWSGPPCLPRDNRTVWWLTVAIEHSSLYRLVGSIPATADSKRPSNLPKRLEALGAQTVARGPFALTSSCGADALAMAGPKAVLLEPVAAVLVQLLVGLGQQRAGEPELVCRPGDGVQQLLPRLCGGVRHRAGQATRTVWSPTVTRSPRCSWRPRRASGAPFTVTPPASKSSLAWAPESARADSLSSWPRRITSPAISICCISPSWQATGQAKADTGTPARDLPAAFPT